MKHKFGWDLPPGVTNRMIEEQAGAFEEEEMSKGMEKLIEEIAQAIVRNYIFYADLEDKPEHRSFAKAIIARIGKAYADGELRLPDEVMFAHTPDKVVENEIATFWEDIWRRMKAEGWFDGGLTTLIALRKEEKKNDRNPQLRTSQ